MLPPFLQALLRRDDLHALEAGAASHHEHALGRHATALDGDAAVRVVRGDGDVGSAEGELLHPQHHAPEEAAAPELRLVELRVRVVMVEEELFSQEFKKDSY